MHHLFHVMVKNEEVLSCTCLSPIMQIVTGSILAWLGYLRIMDKSRILIDILDRNTRLLQNKYDVEDYRK